MKKQAIHLCVYNKNVGDNALNLAIDSMLEPHFHLKHMGLLGNKFGVHEVRELRATDVVIFGGGGLIHSYSPSNTWKRTGTMWNIRLQDLASIPNPIVLYGVGFNHFYGEPGPTQQMKLFFDTLIDKGALISLRNDGSKKRLVQHFPHLASHLQTIPDPGFFFRPKPARWRRPHAILQIAADRPQYRFKNKPRNLFRFIRKIRPLIKHELVVVPHTADDAKLYQTKHFNVGDHMAYPFKPEVDATKKIIGLYAGAEFSISMRGHSQICSIGNNTPTFTISTHPKTHGLMEECGLQEYCYDYGSENQDQGYHKFEHFLSHLDEYRTRLKKLNSEFDACIANFNQQVIR